MDLRQIGRSVGKRIPFKLSKFYPSPDLYSSTNSVPIHCKLGLPPCPWECYRISHARASYSQKLAASTCWM